MSTIRGIASALAVMPSGFLVDTLGWRLGLFLSEITGTLAVLMLVLGRSVPLNTPCFSSYRTLNSALDPWV